MSILRKKLRLAGFIMMIALVAGGLGYGSFAHSAIAASSMMHQADMQVDIVRMQMDQKPISQSMMPCCGDRGTEMVITLPEQNKNNTLGASGIVDPSFITPKVDYSIELALLNNSPPGERASSFVIKRE